METESDSRRKTIEVVTFRARSLQEAVRRVRQELGPEASILHTRWARATWSNWILGSRELEVAAGIDPEDGLDQDVDWEIESALETRHESSREGSSDQIASHVATTGPIEICHGTRKIVAFVGATGVGKTTTVAKLAANFRLREKAKVGVITVDTFRIGAIDQLKTYTKMIDLPLAVASSESEAKRALEEMIDMDLVLVDTTGCSPRDLPKLQHARRLLSHLQVDETHLLISAASDVEAGEFALGQFARFSPSAVLLTKTDESRKLSRWADWLREKDARLSYVTFGQNVPHDISAPRSDELSAYLSDTT